jgi:hypothetical protein
MKARYETEMLNYFSLLVDADSLSGDITSQMELYRLKMKG